MRYRTPAFLYLILLCDTGYKLLIAHTVLSLRLLYLPAKGYPQLPHSFSKRIRIYRKHFCGSARPLNFPLCEFQCHLNMIRHGFIQTMNL